MKKSKLLLVGMMSLLLIAGLVIALGASAQGPGSEEEMETAGAVGAAGLTDPVPDGYRLMYIFTNAANNLGGDDAVATVIHCTNYGSENVEVSVVMYGFTRHRGIHGNENPRQQPDRHLCLPGCGNFRVGTKCGGGDQQRGFGPGLGHRRHCDCAGHLVDPVADADQPTFVSSLDLYEP